MTTEKRVPRWRSILAAILDFITAFAVLGYIIGALTGGLTENGFQLNGVPALALFVAIFLYFWAGRKYAGGTIWQYILRATPPR